MSEKYNIPEPNSLDSMEGTNIRDDFSIEESAIDEKQEKQSVEDLLYDLIYSESAADDDGYRNKNVSPEEMRKIRNENIEVIRKGMKEMIKEWHDLIKPKYVVLTETAGTPFGYVFKEIWRNAFPDEGLPIFYRFNPRYVETAAFNYKEIIDFLKNRFENKEENTILFEESIGTGGSMWTLEDMLTLKGDNWDIYGGDSLQGIIRREMDENEYADRSYEEKERLSEMECRGYLENMALKKEKLFPYWGFGAKGKDDLQSHGHSSARARILPVPKRYRVTKKDKYYIRDSEPQTLRAKIKKGEEGKVALDNIKKLKRLGMLLGQEMKEGAERK